MTCGKASGDRGSRPRKGNPGAARPLEAAVRSGVTSAACGRRKPRVGNPGCKDAAGWGPSLGSAEQKRRGASGAEPGTSGAACSQPPSGAGLQRLQFPHSGRKGAGRVAAFGRALRGPGGEAGMSEGAVRLESRSRTHGSQGEAGAFPVRVSHLEEVLGGQRREAGYLGRPARSKAGCGAGPAGSCPRAGAAAAAPGAGRRGPGRSYGCSCSSQTRAPGHSLLRGRVSRVQRGAHAGAGPPRGAPPPQARPSPGPAPPLPQPSSSEPSWQLGCRSQRRSAGRHSPLPQVSWLGEQRPLEAGSPGEAVVGTVKGTVPAARAGVGEGQGSRTGDSRSVINRPLQPQAERGTEPADRAPAFPSSRFLPQPPSPAPRLPCAVSGVVFRPHSISQSLFVNSSWSVPREARASKNTSLPRYPFDGLLPHPLPGTS